MATSGRRLTLALVCLALTGTFGCTSASDGTGGEGKPSNASNSSDTSKSSAPPGSSAPPTSTAKPSALGAADFCPVAPPPAWAARSKERRYPSGTGLDRRGIAVGADGDTLIAVDSGPERSELVRLRNKGGDRRVIHSIDPLVGTKKIQYGSVRFDGRWVVFEVSHDAENWNDWSLYAWDSTGDAEPFLVTRHDKKIAGPFLFVQVQGGKAAWTEGTKSGKKAVHAYDLAARKDSVVHTGQVSPVFAAGDLLGWREASSASSPVQIKAVSFATGKPVELPPVIAKIRGAAHVTGDGDTWAWVSPDYRTLYAWQPGWKESATIAKAAEDEHIDQMELSGDLISWVGGKAVWAADLRSHSRTTLTPEYGSAVANGESLLVSYLEGGYTKDPSKRKGTTSYVLKAPELAPLPVCTSWKPIPQPTDETGAPGTEQGVTM